jgi:ParB-like chromosome segregation protein Spo0J
MKIKISDVVLRTDLYPRQEADNKKIQEYSENTELLPPIIINQDNILIDGLHRLRANKQAGNTEIEVIVEKTASENEIYLRAIETNATHGLQLSMKDKQSVAIKLYDLKNRERLIKSLSIAPRTFDGWVSNKSKQLKEQKEEEAISLYLHAELTQKEVADKVGVTQQTISNRIDENTKYCNSAEFGKSLNFTPFLYNIWNTSKENKTGVSQTEISRIIQNCKNADMNKSLNFTPFLYNIWNTSKICNKLS